MCLLAENEQICLVNLGWVGWFIHLSVHPGWAWSRPHHLSRCHRVQTQHARGRAVLQHKTGRIGEGTAMDAGSQAMELLCSVKRGDLRWFDQDTKMTRLSSRCLWDICFLEIYLQRTTVFVKGLSVPISDITTETRCRSTFPVFDLCKWFVLRSKQPGIKHCIITNFWEVPYA
jgi:hypothetical protein